MGRQRMGLLVIPGARRREPGIQAAVVADAGAADPGIPGSACGPRNDIVGYFAPGAMMARTSAMMSGGVA
jgi:hypothetical protein